MEQDDRIATILKEILDVPRTHLEEYRRAVDRACVFAPPTAHNPLVKATDDALIIPYDEQPTSTSGGRSHET